MNTTKADRFGNYYTASKDLPIVSYQELLDVIKKNDEKSIVILVNSSNPAWFEVCAKSGMYVWYITTDGEIAMATKKDLPKIGTHSPGVNVMIYRVNNSIVEILLIEEINMKGKWKFVSGCLDRGETATTCAKRECFEETALVLDELTFIMCHERPSLGRCGTDDLIFCFKSLVTMKQEVKIQPSEISKFTWVAIDKILESQEVEGMAISNFTKNVIFHTFEMEKYNPNYNTVTDWITQKHSANIYY